MCCNYGASFAPHIAESKLTTMISVTRKISYLLFFVAAGLVLTSCLKNKDDQPSIPNAGLMAFNLAPDQEGGIFVRLSGNTLGNQPLSFTNFTGGYLPIYIGSRDVRTVDARTGAELAATNGYAFDSSKYYTLFVTGADSVYTNLLVNDHLDTLLPASGEALVRYIQAIPDSSAFSVKLSSGSKELPTTAAFKTVSDFASMPTGDLKITASNGSGITLERTITVEANKAYTVLIIGHPSATDDSRKPQIKFIVNGTVKAPAEG